MAYLKFLLSFKKQYIYWKCSSSYILHFAKVKRKKKWRISGFQEINIVIQAFRRLRQEDSELKASLYYTESLKSGWATQRSYVKQNNFKRVYSKQGVKLWTLRVCVHAWICVEEQTHKANPLTCLITDRTITWISIKLRSQSGIWVVHTFCAEENKIKHF